MTRAAGTSGASSTEDAIALLKADHATVKKLFEEFEGAQDEEEKQAIAELICKLLSVHARIEEELFYPAAREVAGAEEEDGEETAGARRRRAVGGAAARRHTRAGGAGSRRNGSRSRRAH